ncbi:hypothetical protein KBD13_03005 [Patescibacteria group bacterium]|nr:hypothetical protein [Patescibacteria group bacterium]
MTSREAILDAMAWYAALCFCPTRSELWLWVRGTRDDAALEALVQEEVLLERAGRLCLSGHEALFKDRDARERAFARKWERLQRMGRVLRWMPSVRFFAIGNTTALGMARDEADIDVFLITHEGTLWLTRCLLVGWAWLFGRRPHTQEDERDAWCFSFLIDDMDLNLERFALAESDPYLAHWVVRLLPIVDDGIGQELWLRNRWAWKGRTSTCPWMSWQRKKRCSWRIPAWAKRFDVWFGEWQCHRGSRALREAAAMEGTNVVMNAHVCKTHLDDRRADYRATYDALRRS